MSDREELGLVYLVYPVLSFITIILIVRAICSLMDIISGKGKSNITGNQ